MTFTSLEAVFVTAAFLVPGFIWSAVVAMTMPVRAVSAQVRLVELLTLNSESFRRKTMARDAGDKNVFNRMADDCRVDGGYQPRSQSGIKPADLKRPKGGSAVERPQPKDVPPPKA